MTEKQVMGLRTTITGAALFIGGAIMWGYGGQWGEISMLAGVILMFCEAVGKVFWRWFQSLGEEFMPKKEAGAQKDTLDPSDTPSVVKEEAGA